VTYSRRTWVNGNVLDQTSVNDFEGRIESEFTTKASEIAAKASTTYVDSADAALASADAALDTRVDALEAFGGGGGGGGGLTATPGTFLAYLNTTQSITNNTLTKVQFNAEDRDPDGWFDSATNYRYTPQLAGTYLFYAAVSFEPATTNTTCQVKLYKNGSAVAELAMVGTSGAQDNTYSGTFQVAANGSTDYFEIFAHHNQGTTKPLYGDATAQRWTYFGGHLLAATPVGPTGVTVLPGSPVDGQEVYYLADSTNGVIWHLRYRSASASAYKWEFVGGGTLSAEVLASVTIPAAQTTYGDISGSTGPSLAVPLAGDYLVAVESYVAGAIGQQAMVSYAVGATAANDSDGAELTIGGSTPAGTDIRANVRRSRLKTITAAATTLTAKYRTSNAAFGAPTVAERVLTVIPIRVG
jgi:hypothetical protein